MIILRNMIFILRKVVALQTGKPQISGHLHFTSSFLTLTPRMSGTEYCSRWFPILVNLFFNTISGPDLTFMVLFGSVSRSCLVLQFLATWLIFSRNHFKQQRIIPSNGIMTFTRYHIFSFWISAISNKYLCTRSSRVLIVWMN